MKNKLIIAFTKLISKVLGLIGRGGSLPGEIALKLNPNILKDLNYPKHIILVTGTNGKTTTTNMIYELMKKHFNKVICNNRGDNLLVGVTTLMIKNTKHNRVNADCVVIEVDELNVPKVLKYVPVTDLVVNNFFRDQLDRAGEMNSVVTKIENALKDYDHNLYLNGDDPNVVRLGLNTNAKKITYYGVSENSESFKQSKEANEGKFCPVCNEELVYDYYQYSHIGKFHCPNCSFGNHQLDVKATNIDLDNKSFVIGNEKFTATQDALYAIYNCVAMISVGKAYQLSYDEMEKTLSEFSLNDGRMEYFDLNGKKGLLNLVKNPTGVNEVLKYIKRNEHDKSLLIVLNDNEQDGRDVSWIWDAQFELIINDQTKTIICSGTRAYDMALRLKYSCFEGNILIIEDKQEAVNALKMLNEDLYIIATYTALQPIRAILRKE